MYDKSTEPNTEASDGSKHATDRQVILLFDICDVIYDEDKCLLRECHLNVGGFLCIIKTELNEL